MEQNNGKIDIALLAYMAGFFDGEGCVGIYRQKFVHRRDCYFLQVGIGNTDKNILDLFQAKFGGSVQPGKLNIGRTRIVFRWYVRSKKASNFLQTILPFLILKKEEASLGVKFQEECPNFALQNNYENGRRRLLTAEQWTQRENYAHQMRQLKPRNSYA